MAPNSKEFSARNDAIVIRGVHDVATHTSAETRKLEGKLDAVVNLVTQLAANQKSASVARVCGIRSSNDHHTTFWMDEHPEAYSANTYNRPPEQHRQGTYREDGSQLLEEFSARNDVIVIRGFHDVATDKSVETRKLEGKLDALVNLVTQLAANQKAASIARVCDIRSSKDHYTSQFSARNDVILIRGVHDEATDTSVETRKLEGMLDALVNMVTQLAANQNPASVPRVCDIRSSNDHHTSVCPSSQQSGVDDHPEFYAPNTYSRRPQE
ncbi:hypothetical protein Fmac_028666 [Flemingia macrophylla]|uniref:Uncharacterized protein n=1 Tax=Flemingia macrophylla TaxID=520843 RepID=A0ABD1L859_9FABA